MKKILSLLLAAFITVSFAACKSEKKLINDEVPIEQQAEFTIVGDWTVARITSKRTEDVLKKSVAQILESYFREGMEVSFAADGTAVCDGEALEYTIEGSELRMEWSDKTKNFKLQLSGDNSAVELNSNDVVLITLTKK